MSRYAVLSLPASTPEEHRDKLQTVQARMSAILDEQEKLQKRALKGERLSPEEETRRLDLSDEYVACDRWLAEPQGKAPRPMPGGGHRSDSDFAVRAITGGREERTVNAMFPRNRDNGGFASMNDFMSAVHYGTDPRLAESQKRAMGEGIGSAGGFLVPDEFASTIFDAGLEDEIVRPRCTLYPMQSDTLHVPALAIGNHSSNLYGGIAAAWATESGTLTEHDPTFRSIVLNAKKLYGYGVCSNEVLADGVGFDQTVTNAFAKAVSFTMDRSFLAGSGAGQPLGILNASCTVTQAKESGQTADTIVYTNLTKMLSRMYAGSYSRAVWIAHPTCIPFLMALTVSVGTGGNVMPVFNYSNGQWTLLTRPCIFTERANPIGDLGDIMLADFSQYAVGLRAAVTVQKSGHVRFATDETAYRATVRVDGSPLWDSALTLADGSTTVSPFVVLQAR